MQRSEVNFVRCFYRSTMGACGVLCINSQRFTFVENAEVHRVFIGDMFGVKDLEYAPELTCVKDQLIVLRHIHLRTKKVLAGWEVYSPGYVFRIPSPTERSVWENREWLRAIARGTTE